VTAFEFTGSWDISALIGHRAKVTAARANVQAISLDVAWSEWHATAQASREDARSVTLACGGILLAHLFPATLLRASAARAQQSPSAADLLASMRANFNVVPLHNARAC
jgi:hypothetical protein